MSNLQMVKPSMSDIPEANIPDGFELRVMRADEKHKWEELCNKSFNGDFDFAHTIEGKTGYVEDGVFVIVDKNDSDEKFVATGTALCGYDKLNGYGYVHMIAADAEYAGKRLGYEITAAVLRRLRDGGFDKAELETDDFRLPAIKTYLSLGFEPVLTLDETMDKRWENIRKALDNKKSADEDRNNLILKAKQGDVMSQYRLGWCYYWAYNGFEQDYKQAVKWLEKAAEQGYIYAQYKLAGCYYEGRGVDEDNAEAVKWYTKAAEQGYGVAQHMLAVCYHHGYKGVEKDYRKAIEWYTKAAEQNDSDDYVVRAQKSLGFIYYCGYNSGTPNYEQAAKWYKKAALERNDSDESKQMLNIIECIRENSK